MKRRKCSNGSLSSRPGIVASILASSGGHASALMLWLYCVYGRGVLVCWHRKRFDIFVVVSKTDSDISLSPPQDS